MSKSTPNIRQSSLNGFAFYYHKTKVLLRKVFSNTLHRRDITLVQDIG